MEQQLQQLWVTLLLLGVSTASAQNVSVSVSCGSSHLVITVPVDLFGIGVPVDADELILGSGCVVTTADLQTLQLEYPLAACGATRRLLPGSIHYRNVLHYVPSATNGVIRASRFSHPIDCFYPRSWNVSSRELQPTWVPFNSTLMDTQRLDFTLEVFDSMWSLPVSDPTYYLGDLINIQASVRQQNHVPLKIYLDECVARPNTESSVKYEVITNHGCLVDGQHSGSRFLATQEHNVIRFQLDTFTFVGASNNQIYLVCHLKAVSAGFADSRNKACSFDRTTASWNSHEGDDCSCCASLTGCESKRRKRQQQQRKGLSEADLEVGPIALKAGLHLPFSTATLVIVVACAFIVSVSILGCYCSTRRSHRGYRMEVVGAALGEAGAVAMAAAAGGTSGAGASGDSSAPSKKATIGVAAASGQSANV
ncbi:oocyte-secreted protein 3 [Tiliqua scincoides]|uniref:oocyte-secreted protein 3 n=1 Tax=Tiliqua scincoides TaxID=71010 RepID=UPI003461B0EC